MDLSYFKKFSGGGVDFMDGREKADVGVLTVSGEPVHIDNHAYLKNDEGEYAVFTVEEMPGFFFFGNSIITEVLKTVDEDGMEELLPKVGARFLSKRSKKNRDYTAIEFVVE